MVQSKIKKNKVDIGSKKKGGKASAINVEEKI